MKILVSGASGLVGSALAPRLRAAGHDVSPITRRSGTEGSAFEPLAPCDAVVHLAGENIAQGRWNAAKKDRIRRSRVDLTQSLVRSFGELDHPPATLVCASAVGFYGDRGEEHVDEGSAAGTGFLAEVCRDWEAAARGASEFGTRVVSLRIGMVLSRDGGALPRMLLPFRLGLGGVIGDGRGWMSWIHLEDLVRLVEFVLGHEAIAGPVNAVAPEPVTNREFTKALGRVLRRPTFLPAPAFALRLLFGELADALLLSSCAALPKRAVDAGFEFRFGELEPALRALCVQHTSAGS